MNRSEQTRYYWQLKERKEKLCRNGQIDDPDSDAQQTGELSDAAIDHAARESAGMFQERLSQEVHAIDDAMQRIREKTFGICEYCGEAIAMARIEALPTATTCISCQKDLEKQEGNGSH